VAHEVIPIPGGGTGASAGAKIIVAGLADEDQTLTIAYNARSTHLSPRLCGILAFSGVVELRWVKFGSTTLLPNSKDYAFTLIRITDSEEVARLRSARRYSESVLDRLSHYRIGWDDWGSIDVISTELTVRETGDECP
jgi:hypothetical protein